MSLHDAAKAGDENRVRELINSTTSSVDINGSDPSHDGWTPLMLACRYGHSEIASLLVESGADLNMEVADGWTALIWACANGHSETASLLINRGANINFGEVHHTALMKACRYGYLETASLLIERGADLNIQPTRNGSTALMYSCYDGYPEIASLLLEKGAHWEIKDQSGNTALNIARSLNEIDCVTVFEDFKKYGPEFLKMKRENSEMNKLLRGKELKLNEMDALLKEQAEKLSEQETKLSARDQEIFAMTTLVTEKDSKLSEQISQRKQREDSDAKIKALLGLLLLVCVTRGILW